MKKGNKFLRCLAILLCILILPAGLLTAGLRMPRLYGESYYAELPDMVNRLKTASGKKLILVGGSSIAFGIDVAQLEEEFPGYTVCPMGLYAAVGTSAMLNLTLPYLSQGDIVVLAMEPSSETYSTYFGANAFWKCAEGDSSLTVHLSADQKSALVGAYIPYLQERAEILSDGSYPNPQGVYTKSAFDGSCNLVYPREGNAMAVGFDTATPVDFSAIVIEEAFAQQVNGFISEAARRGAAVYLSFAPVNRLALDDSWQQGLERFFNLCAQAFRCRIISNPETMVMDSGWFYDNNFHLNTPGSRVRTHILACDLLAEQGIYAEPEFEMPAMPESIYSAPENTDTGGQDFVLEAYSGGWRVTGLTESGLSKTALTLPESQEGKPVIAFSPGALAGADKLEELTLPESIQSLPDGLFADAPNLTRLILLHETTVPALGADPFAGAERLKVYVPRDSYGLYRDGAGCEENQWQPYLSRIETF